MESLRKLIDIVEQGRLPAPMEPTYKPGPGGQLIPDIDVNLNPDMKSTRPRTPASSTLPPLDAPMEPTYKKGPGGQLVPDIDYKLNPGMKPQSGTVTPPKPASRPQPAAPRNTPKMPTVPQPGAAIKKITEHDIDQEVAAIIEEINKVAEGGPFSYGAKNPRKGSVAANAEQKRRERERGKQPVEPRDQQVGTAKVTKGVAETSDYFRRRDREESIISGKNPARKKQPAQTSDYAKRREQEKKQGVAEDAGKTQKYEMMMRNGQVKRFTAKDDADAKRIAAGHGAKSVIRMKGNVPGDKIAEQGVAESEQSMSVQQLATVSDEALDKAYGYGRSSPGNTFGWQANLKSAEFAKRMIDSGETDIEKISDAIHKGWNVTAQEFVKNPDHFDDTEKLRAAGKLDAKLQQRAKLMKISYSELPDDEKEKDRVVARALLQAIKGNNKEESLGEGLSFKDYLNLVEAKKKNHCQRRSLLERL